MHYELLAEISFFILVVIYFQLSIDFSAIFYYSLCMSLISYKVDICHS